MLNRNIASPSTMLPDGRMDTANAARYLGCSTKTLAHWRCSGTGPRFTKPGRVFYAQSDLDAWISAKGKHTSTAQSRAFSASRDTRRIPTQPLTEGGESIPNRGALHRQVRHGGL